MLLRNVHLKVRIGLRDASECKFFEIVPLFCLLLCKSGYFMRKMNSDIRLESCAVDVLFA